MVKYNTLIFSMLATSMLTFNSYISSMQKYKKYGVSIATLATASYLWDKYDKREIIDLSNPSEPIAIKELLNNLKGKRINHGFTRDYYFDSSRSEYDEYYKNVKKWVKQHCWVLSNSAEKLADLIITTSYQEQESNRNNSISFVHGTQKGASLLFRTMLDEVMNDRKIERFTKLRDKAETKYESAEQFFIKEALAYLKSSGGLRVNTPTGGSVIVHPAEHIAEKNLLLLLEIFGGIPFDKLLGIREKLLSANFSLCSNYSWILDGYKEGTLDYISDHCSLMSYCMNLIYSSFCLIFCPWAIGHLIKKIVQDPASIKDLPYMLSEEIKTFGLYEEDLFKEIFKRYKVDHLYEKYKTELDRFSRKANATVVQINIPRNLVNKYIYLSMPLGNMRKPDYGNTSEAIKKCSNIKYQARILLKPEFIDYDLAAKNNVSMRFYMYIKPEDLHEMTKRMYEIALEIKEELDKELIK